MIIPFWLKIVGPLALLGMIWWGFSAYIGHVDRTARKEQKAADYAAVEKVQMEAKAADLKHAREVETARAIATKEANDVFAPTLASYQSRLSDYTQRLRDQADQGRRDRAAVPGAPDRPNVTDGPDRLSVLDDDLARCTQAVVRLENARDWWVTIEKAPK